MGGAMDEELPKATAGLEQSNNKHDVDINTSDTSTPTHNQISGPITRARACQLNNQVSSFLASYSSYLDNGNVHSILLLRNDRQE
jgi:ribosomal protein S17E